MSKIFCSLIAVLLLILPFNQKAFGQCNTSPCTVPVPFVDAQEACILPNPAALDCYHGATFPSTPVSFPPSWCTTIENNHLFAFRADADTAKFVICTYDCSASGAIQAAVLSTLDCINFDFVSPCLGNIQSGTCQELVARNLTIGNVYFLMIDGSAGALCNYTINGVSPIATIEPAGPISINYGDTVTLDAGPGYASWHWNTGDTTQQITVSDCGEYSVTVVDSNGCSATTIAVKVFVSPIITFNNGILLSTPSSNYQWLLNGDSIPGATGQTYVPTVSGDYLVQVNCPGGGLASSNVIPVVIAGLSETTLGQLKMYPNPVSDQESELTIELPGIDPQAYTLLVSDLAGREFLRKSEAFFSEKATLETGKIPAGSYFVQLWQKGKRVATGMFLKI